VLLLLCHPYRNPLPSSTPPNIGAYNWTGDVLNSLSVWEETFNLYPNPVESGEVFELKIPEHIHAQHYSFQMLDFKGKII